MSLYVDIRKNLGSFNLDVEFDTNSGTLALLGASGCGKSMTLKCIAGIETPDEGTIVLDGETLFDSGRKINLAPQMRRTGYLFQNSALFPNMTSRQNILCGMRKIKDKAAKLRRLQELVQMFRLEGLESHYPAQLSGGQQQRVALARILASEPEVIMLDEPFSALDSHLKWQLEQELGNILAELNVKAIFVSHDRNEAYRLCDRIAVLSDGSIDVIGGRGEIFLRPDTYSACILTGCKNISKAVKTSEQSIYASDWALELKTSGAAGDDMSFVGVKAHHLTPCAGPEVENAFEYEIVRVYEDVFSQILIIRNKKAPASQTIRWEMTHEAYEGLQGLPNYACIPPSNILLLK